MKSEAGSDCVGSDSHVFHVIRDNLFRNNVFGVGTISLVNFSLLQLHSEKTTKNKFQGQWSNLFFVDIYFTNEIPDTVLKGKTTRKNPT